MIALSGVGAVSMTGGRAVSTTGGVLELFFSGARDLAGVFFAAPVVFAADLVRPGVFRIMVFEIYVSSRNTEERH